MNRFLALNLPLFLVLGSQAQTINVRGKITGTGNAAIANAQVELAKGKQKATSGADGSYAITGTTAISKTGSNAFDRIRLEQGALQLDLGVEAPIRVELFDAKGNLLHRAMVEKAQAGKYRFELAERAPANQMIIVKASIGAESKSIPYLAPSQEAARTQTSTTSATESFGAFGALAKVSAIIDIPSDYKPDHPYRLFFCFHWYGGSADSIASGQVEFGNGGGPANYAYYGLKPLATAANDPAIFIAPQGLNNGWGGEDKDHKFFEDMLALAKTNLCVDTTRVFATGFSFGSMFSYSLSTNHQKQMRAAVGIAPANWNIWIPTPLSREPIAWMQTTGLSDPSCKWINDASKEEGAKFIGLQRGKDNGCTVPSDIPTTTVGSKSHSCYDFAGCKSGYPVKVCTFDGAHIANVGDGGTGNVGKNSWIPKESWKFFTQF